MYVYSGMKEKLKELAGTIIAFGSYPLWLYIVYLLSQTIFKDWTHLGIIGFIFCYTLFICYFHILSYLFKKVVR